jgi:hypothetical protein
LITTDLPSARARLLKSTKQDSSPFQFLLDEGISVLEVETDGFTSFGIHTHFLGAVAFGAPFLGCMLLSLLSVVCECLHSFQAFSFHFFLEPSVSIAPIFHSFWELPFSFAPVFS